MTRKNTRMKYAMWDFRDFREVWHAIWSWQCRDTVPWPNCNFRVSPRPTSQSSDTPGQVSTGQFWPSMDRYSSLQIRKGVSFVFSGNARNRWAKWLAYPLPGNVSWEYIHCLQFSIQIRSFSLASLAGLTSPLCNHVRRDCQRQAFLCGSLIP